MLHRAGLLSKLAYQGENMFTLDPVIDAVHTGHKTMVNTFVTNEKIAAALNSLADTQAEFTKKSFKVITDTASTVSQEMTKVAQDAAKVDFAKVSENMVKVFQGTAKK